MTASPITTPPPDPEKLKKAETGYMVLVLDDAGAWALVGRDVQTRSAEHAIRQHAEKTSGADDWADDVTLVAVPARSWQPYKVTAKVTTALVLEDVKP